MCVLLESESDSENPNAPGSVPRIDHGMAIGGAAAARQQGRCACDVQIETWRPPGTTGTVPFPRKMVIFQAKIWEHTGKSIVC